MLGEDIIGELVRLRKTIDSFAYLELHPTIAIKIVEILFENEFLWDIRKADTHALTTIKRVAQV